MKRPPWTAKDLALLKERYGKVPVADLAKTLKRTVTSVHHAGHRLGLSYPVTGWDQSNWTAEQDRALAESYAVIPVADLAAQLHKTVSAVNHRASRLGITRQWTAEQDAMLRELYPATPAPNLVPVLHKSLSAIRSRAHRFGLELNRQPTITCANCSKPFVRSKSLVRDPRNFCCRRCHLLYYPSEIELRMADALTAANIAFERQFQVSRWYLDFVIVAAAPRVAIECDGEYWHGTKRKEADKQAARDKKVNDYLAARPGWLLLRFTESEINGDLAGCVARIQSAIKPA